MAQKPVQPQKASAAGRCSADDGGNDSIAGYVSGREDCLPRSRPRPAGRSRRWRAPSEPTPSTAPNRCTGIYGSCTRTIAAASTLEYHQPDQARSGDATTSAQTRPFARSTAIATGSKRADQGQLACSHLGRGGSDCDKLLADRQSPGTRRKPND